MDARFALRSFIKQPVFCLTAILTLALGIGANTAIFSVFDAVILRPFPYRDPSRVVMVWQKRPTGQMNSVAGIHYHEWIKQSTTFEKLAGIIPQPYNVGAGDDLVQAQGARVSANFFSTLGVQPALGRDFAPGDEKPGSPHVAILSYGLWQSQFGRNRALLGQNIRLSGEPFTLIGVLPQNFDFVMQNIDVWVPLIFEGESELNATKMAVLGRMQPSVSVEKAGQEMGVVAKRLESQFPDYKGWGAMVISLQDIIGGGRIRPALTALLVAVGLVLLIACANVANLLLARSDVRYKEVAIRSALGASRARLMRQLITETMLLALAGSLAGLALAYGGLRLLLTIAAGQLPRIEGVALDARVLGFTVLVTVITGLLFGLFPAHQLLGGDLQIALRESGRGSNNSSTGRRSRNVLVVSEIALSLMLAIGATVMLRSLLWLENQSRGFSPDHQLSFRVALSSPELSNSSQRTAYYQRMLERIKALPGARAVAATNNLPVDGYREVGMYFHPAGSAPDSAEPPVAAVDMINPGYFKALGIPIIRGREFDDRDREGAPLVAIISNSLAREFFAGQNPIGRNLIVGDAGIAREIVGVAGDIRYLTKLPADSVEIYLPYAQKGWPAIHVVVRTDGDPGSMAPAVRAALLQAGWRQPISDVRTMAERIDTVNGKARLYSVLAAMFAVIALLLAGVGIYGVVSYSVLQRSKEIGIRMALGANRGDILRWIVRQAIVLAAAGIAIGLAGHFALARVLRSLLYGTSPNDTAAWVGASVTLGLIAVVASYIPARRATRSDPVTALRAE
jgi:putative ABC transport system permease protein